MNHLQIGSLIAEKRKQLGLSLDALFGYSAAPVTEYEQRYSTQDYYWGIIPNELCYEILRLKPPVKPYRVLEIGCGEGKDSVFLAQDGYSVTAFDAAKNGLEKARQLAKRHHVSVNFFQADLNHYLPTQEFDIIFSSGILHYLSRAKRQTILEHLKNHTSFGGLHVHNAHG